jgi:hypothetical protein
MGCTSIFYYPRIKNSKFYDPIKVGLIQEEVEIDTELGTRVHAWWFSSAKNPAKGTVIFFHGNAENLTTHFLSLSWLPAEGYNYLIWDYPGYGVSEGEPTPKNNVIAAHAVLKWVNKNKDNSPLIIYGQSLGGNIAMKAVLDMKDQLPIKALVVDGSFRSYRSIARKKASESWLLWLFQPIAWLVMSDQYAPDNLKEFAPIPLLVIHGQQDPVVPPQFGDDIFSKASEPKQIWRIEDGYHGDTFWRHDKVYRKKFTDYLSSLNVNLESGG